MSKAVFFDLDDTLHSLRVYSLERLKTVAQTVGQDHRDISPQTFYHALVKYYDEGYRTDLLNCALEQFCIFKEQYLSELIKVYRSNRSTVSLYDDSLPLLELLSQKNVSLFLLTDGVPESQRCKVVALNLEQHFDKIIYTGEFDEHLKKPCAKLFLDTLEEHGIDARSSLAVGDNPHCDFIELKKNGMTTLRIKRDDGRFSHIVLDEMFEADFNVATLREVVYFLELIDDQ